MRVTLTIDSATPEEVYELTLAFQRTAHEFILPRQITTEPTVTVCGMGMGWVSPSMTEEQAVAVLAELHESVTALAIWKASKA